MIEFQSLAISDFSSNTPTICSREQAILWLKYEVDNPLSVKEQLLAQITYECEVLKKLQGCINLSMLELKTNALINPR